MAKHNVENDATQDHVQFSDHEWDLIGEVVVSSRMDGKRIDHALLDAGRVIGQLVAEREAHWWANAARVLPPAKSEGDAS